MCEKPGTTQPQKPTRPEAVDTPTGAMRSQTARQPDVAPAEASLRPADIARAKIAKLGVSEADVVDAIRWARSTEQPSSC